ncbi:hypothetical protein [Streptomyces sp. NPDC051109]|uniref:hypothetical protein n=1 Tax=Streptomyces sp. NPDC051109 TaxID=3365642 RepID=UPI0037A44C60
MRRWPLPLLLAALLAASGCVTVHPAPHPARQSLPRHPGGPQAAAAPRPDTGPGLPLSGLPKPSTAPEDDHRPAPGGRAPAAREASDENRHARHAPQRKAAPPRHAVKPKPTKAKAQPSRTPAHPARPATGAGTDDMAALCRAAHDVTSTAITALCHQTYGR